MTVNIDAEMHVNMVTFLKEQTYFFFFSHRNTLNKGVLICASLTFINLRSPWDWGVEEQWFFALSYKELKLF